MSTWTRCLVSGHASPGKWEQYFLRQWHPCWKGAPWPWLDLEGENKTKKKKSRIQEDEILSRFPLFFRRLWPANLSHLGSWDSGQEVIFNMKWWKHSLWEPLKSNRTQVGSSEGSPPKKTLEGPALANWLWNRFFKKVSDLPSFSGSNISAECKQESPCSFEVCWAFFSPLS